jgi:hypothetical protein
MKRFIPLFLSILFTTALLAQTIEKTYFFSNPEISKIGDYNTISINNAMSFGITGEPSLPYQTIKLLLPPGEKAVSIEFIGEDELILSSDLEIYPQQASKPISQPGIFHLQKNNHIYNSNTLYPTVQTGELLTQYLNGYAFAISSFTPVRYNPITGEIRIFQKVTIRIKTEASEQSEQSLENICSNEVILSRVSDFAQNEEMLKEYPFVKVGADDYEILIITPEYFIPAFEELTNFYLLRGLKSKIISIEDLDTGMIGDDLQERMRNYIIDQYQDHNIRFVLLGGDTQHVPSRGFYGFVYSGEGYEDFGIPSDLYYSALDGNWNNDNDSQWGETGEEDFLPEVAVGRFPIQNSEELDILIHKTISYQNNPVLGEFNNALFAGEALWEDPITYGSDYLEMLIGHQTDNGYETWGIPETYNIEKLYDDVEYWDAQSFMAAVNSGKQYVHHVGHADYNYVSFMYNEDITNENFSGANGIDHNYTIFHSHGCVCGAFDYDDCILERMVCINNFAVATIGNSRFGWFNEGQTEGPAVHLHREMMDALYHQELYNLGEAFMIAKINTAPWITAPGQWEEGALKWNFYDLNILGDPSLAVWTQEPISIDAEYENVLQINALSTNLNVTSNLIAAANLNCVILKNGIIHGIGITDIDGNATINIDPAFTEIGNAQLVISGNNCKPHIYNISVEDFSGIDQTTANELKIYPNPANDFINVYIPTGFDFKGSAFVFSQNGQELIKQKISSDNFMLDISKLSKGHYIVTFSNNVEIISASFTKNNN